MPLIEFDLETVWQPLAHLALAFILALPIGWDREVHGRSLGFRTFPLIAMSSCAFMLIARGAYEAHEAQAKVFEGLIAGIGFVGAGAIVKQGADVRGTATAAAVWATAALGVSVAYGRLDIAIAVSVMTFGTLVFARPVKRALNSDAAATNGDNPPSD